MRNFFAAVIVALLHHASAGPSDLTVSHASNLFASQLYQELAKTPGNVLVCPVSVHIALALVHQGAGGMTRSQLADTLHLSDSNDNVKNNYKALLTGLQDQHLKIATKLFPAASFKPKPEYVSTAQEYFLSDVQALDFSKAAEAANIINTFVENRTNNKIHDIVKPDSLSDQTRLIIINAVHFKAGWAKMFPRPIIDNFKVTPTQSVKTEFLSQTDYFPFKEDKALGAKILKMDYEYGKYSMVFVLPNKEDGLPELEAKLATTSMDTLLGGMRDVRVEVTIPKFKIEQQMELKDPLVKLGITDLFDSRADLSNLAVEGSLFVTSVIQKTFIDVNENGTEAAAATGIITPLSGGSEDNTFFAKRPFLYYLVDHKIPAILFNGRLVQPTEKIKTPPKKSDDKKGENFNSQVGVIDGNFNRFNEEGSFSPEPQNGLDHNRPNSPTSFGQTSPNNRVNQNRYTTPPDFQLNHGQNNRPSNVQNINQQNLPTNYGQHNPDPYYHYQSTPAPQQYYGVRPTGQFQNPNTYQQSSPFSHQTDYRPQYQRYGY